MAKPDEPAPAAKPKPAAKKEKPAPANSELQDAVKTAAKAFAELEQKVSAESKQQTDELFDGAADLETTRVEKLKGALLNGSKLLVSKGQFREIIHETLDRESEAQAQLTKLRLEQLIHIHRQRMAIIMFAGGALILTIVLGFWLLVLPKKVNETRAESKEELGNLNVQIKTAKQLQTELTGKNSDLEKVNDKLKTEGARLLTENGEKEAKLKEVEGTLADAQKKAGETAQVLEGMIGKVALAEKIIAARKNWVAVVDSPSKYSLIPLSEKLEDKGRAAETITKYLVDREPVSVNPVDKNAKDRDTLVRKSIDEAEDRFEKQIQSIRSRYPDCLLIHWHALRPDGADVNNTATSKRAQNALLRKLASAFRDWPGETKPKIVIYSRSELTEKDVRDRLIELRSEFPAPFDPVSVMGDAQVIGFPKSKDTEPEAEFSAKTRVMLDKVVTAAHEEMQKKRAAAPPPKTAEPPKIVPGTPPQEILPGTPIREAPTPPPAGPK